MTRLLLLGVLLGLALPVRAQVGRVEIRLNPQVPVTGLSAEASVRFLDTRPTAASLFIRPVGGASFQELVATEQEEGLWIVEVPFPIPPEGIETYASYVLQGQTFTEPAQAPEASPVRVPAFTAAVTSDLVLPARQYRMVAVPLQLGSLSGVSVTLGSDAPIDVFGDDFGASGDPSLWRLLRWDQAAERYRDAVADAAAAPFVRVRPGIGYWLITSAGGSFDVEAGISAGAVFEGDVPVAMPVTVTLRPGWNQIGNPYFFPIRWDDVERSSSVEDPVSFDGRYNGGQAVLQPWEGYFVFNGGGQSELRFVARPAAGSVDGRPLAERMRERAGPRAAVLSVTALAGESSDAVYLGLGAANSEAPLDLRKPPAVDDGLRLSAQAHGEEWVGTFRDADAAQWTLSVTADTDVSLRLDAYGDWPAGLVVEDVDRGERLSVIGGVVRVAAVPGVETRTLRVRLADGVDSETPRPPTFGVPRPNPSVGEVEVPYEVTLASPVLVEVIDVLGRVIRQLDEGDRAVGTHAVRWDGRDGEGQPAASGVYLLRLRSDAGTSTVRITRLQP